MERTPRIAFDREALAALCRRWHLKRLAFFGSVMRDDFGPDSDVDVLYEFEEGYWIGWDIIDVMDELSAPLGGWKVDFVSFKYIDRRLRDRILGEAQTVYEAA